MAPHKICPAALRLKPQPAARAPLLLHNLVKRSRERQHAYLELGLLNHRKIMKDTDFLTLEPEAGRTGS